ncbi:hypothetical protein T484DRAFT_1760222 [Baffinella frigidus]|nr:hypothetical protein T484DRAFT_1760222 [Cryptophyta sp. CCMP2293]
MQVAFSIAPATATASVLSNKLFAAAYGGAHTFVPVEIFYQQFSSTIMAYLLVHDVRNPKSVANPAVPFPGGYMAWLGAKAFHGGFMRVGYMFTSISELAALLFYKRQLGAWAVSRRGVMMLGGTGAAVLLYVGLQIP